MPNTRRFETMIYMCIFTISHILMKVLACALILRLSEFWFMFYVAGDMAIFMSFKLIRGDLRYWLPIPGFMSWVVSFMIRLISKTLTDFTLLIQLRHPMELGGRYWCTNLVMNQLFCFVSVTLYVNYSDDELEGSENSILFLIVTSLFILTIGAFSMFLFLINREYLSTFTGNVNSTEYVIQNYQQAEEDEIRFGVFSHHRAMFDPIDIEIKKWLRDNWRLWVETQPEWFTARTISLVPADYLPILILKELGGAKGRRASLDKLIAAEDLKVLAVANARKTAITKKAKKKKGNQVVPD